MPLTLRDYRTATDFLCRARGFLEADECVNGLMLGIALSLEKDLHRFGSQPFFATVEEGAETILASVMTPPYKLQILGREGVGHDALRLLAAKLREDAWSVPALLAESGIAHAFGAIWHGLTGAEYREGMRQRIHKLTTVNEVRLPPGHFRAAVQTDLDLAVSWGKGFHHDCFGTTEVDNSEKTVREKVGAGGVFFWVTDRPVAMAARTRPTARGESISYVYTPPENRRRGYATAVVAHVAKTLLREGREYCSLFTDLANPTSNSIYRKVGFAGVADMVDVVFAATSPRR